MKIHGIKLNKKNFWIPFLVSSILSFLIFLFTISLLVSDFNFQKVWIIMMASLPSSILPLIIISLPSFFIIKRLLSKTPKKVFYFELPLLVTIYLVITFINNIIGLMIGGPRDATIPQILTLITPQIIFVIIWIFLLTISLYFYYKKFIYKENK